MNLIIELAIELAARLTGKVVVHDFSKDGVAVFQVTVNGDVYAYNPTMGWFVPDAGDYAPAKYEAELRERLIKGAIYALRPAQEAPAQQQSPVVPVPPPVQVPTQQRPVSKTAYRRTSKMIGPPTHPEEPCRRCKGKGVMPYAKDNGICYWCSGTTFQATGWATHKP